MSQSAAPTTTSGGLLVGYAAKPPLDIYSVELDCPAIDGTSYTTAMTDQVYSIACGVSLDGGNIAFLLA